ncbi:MAG: EAL and HDOD domain-containing protein [Hylemonella sp.]|uniref:EAL and HDOD domain-containing protein n=1 Tax=Hylemonella sp. TaxID=2066020 RepID=UPI00391A79F6
MSTPSEASALPDTGDQTAIARQAILDESRNVIAYELYDRSKKFSEHSVASDAEMLFNVLSHAELQSLIGRKLMYLNCTHESLSGKHLELIHPERVVLEVPPVADHGATEIEARIPAMEAVKARGFRLAFGHQTLARQYAAWLPLASFIKIDLQKVPADKLEPLVRFAEKHSGAQVIAEKVETVEQYELAAKVGIKLFQGYWFATPVLVRGQTLRPAQAHIIQLINLIRKPAEVGEIEELLKRDPTLSFNLLRFINSAGFGLNVEISSFRHAVMLLGLQKLFRWAALLMTTSRMGETAPAVGKMAVVRGRLMELLVAELLPPEHADDAFVVGIFSLLDTMLGLPMAQALESISLSSNITDALLQRKGMYAPFLELTLACESADDEAFARAATQLQLSNHQVNWAHLQALAWAESLDSAA